MDHARRLRGGFIAPTLDMCGAGLWQKTSAKGVDYGFVASFASAGACNIRGSSGMMTHAIGYDTKPITVMQATISHTIRTRVTSTSKYSEKPRQTPAIF